MMLVVLVSDRTSKMCSTKTTGLRTSKCSQYTCFMGEKSLYMYVAVFTICDRGTNWGGINYPGAYTR